MGNRTFSVTYDVYEWYSSWICAQPSTFLDQFSFYKKMISRNHFILYSFHYVFLFPLSVIWDERSCYFFSHQYSYCHGRYGWAGNHCALVLFTLYLRTYPNDLYEIYMMVVFYNVVVHGKISLSISNVEKKK